MRDFTRSMLLKIFIVAIAALIGTCSVAFATVVPKKPISMGKDFYIVFPHAAYGDQYLEALINSPVKQRIHLLPAGKLGGGGFKNIPSDHSEDIEAGIFHQEKNSEVVDVKGAARITTQSPVSIIGQFGIPGISGTYTALPISAWGTQYMVLDEMEGTNSGYSYYPGVYSVPQVTIIASQPNTNITITLPSGVVQTARGQTGSWNINLNAGDVYYFTDKADPNAIPPRVEQQCESPYGDFTGTTIVSDDPKKPIGVIVSQSHTTEPCGDNECGDFGMEWLPPICNWDTSYVITPSVPHGGTISGQSEILRVVCAYPNTTMWTYNGSGGRDTIGVFAGGYPLYFGQPILVPYVLSGDQPFLVDEITTKPQSCLVGNRGGGANYTFSMVFLTGVDQWSDFVPFSTADQSSGSQVNLYFRQKDEKNLFIDGVPLNVVNPVSPIAISGGFAYLSFPIGPDSYHEMRGINGATAGGSCFGYCSTNFSSNNGGSKHTLNPEMNKSFAHPIGINALPACSPDTTPPHVAINYLCGRWFPDTAWDDELDPPATGIYDIYLAENVSTGVFPPDSSYNVQFNPAPNFQLGTNFGVPFGIDVQNLADTAVAALHVRDGAGNEYDTILVYIPPKLLVAPQFINVGSVRQNNTAQGFVVITDSGNAPTIFTTFRLAIGQHWKILNPPPSLPFTIPVGASDTFFFQYTAPVSQTFECDPDTLIVNTCKQFPIAEMIGCTKKPAIFSDDYNFFCHTIDTLGMGGDTGFTPLNKYGVYIASIGTDTLHLTGATIVPIAGNNLLTPSKDFAILGYYDKLKKANVALPDTMPPGDTVFATVSGHPTVSDPNLQALILWTDDANHYLRDTSILTICGEAPGIAAQSVNFGTHLYATTKDTFVVVKNTGFTQVLVKHVKQLGPDSLNFVAYPSGSGYTDPTSGRYIQYPNDTITYNVADTNQYPYRFVARKLGANLDSLRVLTDITEQPLVDLIATVVEPHIWGQGSCPNDSVFVGSSGTQTILIGNQGTDVLTIDGINIGGTADAPEWGNIKIVDSATHNTIPWPPPPNTQMQPGDIWIVTLTFTPIHTGNSIATVHLTGYDALGRHSNDSATSFYNWGTMPYDTTVSICNTGFSQGVTAFGMDVGPQYVSLSKDGFITITDTGKGVIIIQDIYTNDSDAQYLILNSGNFPDTLQPGQSLKLPFTFNPHPGSGGARHYQVKYIVVNSTGDTVYAIAQGTGVMVTMYTHIDSTRTLDGQPDIATLYLDSLDDPIGNAGVRGFIMEMTYFNRTVVLLNKAYNLGSNNNGANAPGEDVNTLAFGATVSDNTSEESQFTGGVRGYYELFLQNTLNQIEKPGVLMRFLFTGIKGLDSSTLNYNIKGQFDSAGNAISYVQMVSSPGQIWVDSVCGLNIAKISYTGTQGLAQNSPNPVNQSTDIMFSLPNDGHVVITVTNALGEVVATPVDQNFTKGRYNVTFDASALPAGLYFYTMETSDGTALRRQMTVVR